MENIIWYDLKGYEGAYAFCLSDKTGITVKSFGKETLSKQGHIVKTAGKIIIPHVNIYGYYTFAIRHKGKQLSYKVHKALAMAFLPEIPGKTYVNHKNGIKTDNRIENLEWCTQVENTIHAWKTGLMESVCRISLDKIKSIQSKYTLNRTKTYAEIGKEYGIDRHTISQVLNKNTRNRYK